MAALPLLSVVLTCPKLQTADIPNRDQESKTISCHTREGDVRLSEHHTNRDKRRGLKLRDPHTRARFGHDTLDRHHPSHLSCVLEEEV